MKKTDVISWHKSKNYPNVSEWDRPACVCVSGLFLPSALSGGAGIKPGISSLYRVGLSGSCHTTPGVRKQDEAKRRPQEAATLPWRGASRPPRTYPPPTRLLPLCQTSRKGCTLPEKIKAHTSERSYYVKKSKSSWLCKVHYCSLLPS